MAQNKNNDVLIARLVVRGLETMDDTERLRMCLWLEKQRLDILNDTGQLANRYVARLIK